MALIQLPPRFAFPDVVDYCAKNVGEEYVIVSNGGPIEDTEDGITVYFTSKDHVLELTGKVILSFPPSYNDCVVIAIYGEKNKLAYCKCNDKKWTPLNVDFKVPYPFGWLDVIFHKHKLYALNTRGELVFFKNISPNSKVITVAEGPPQQPLYPSYLVESSDGGLLMVSQCVDIFYGEHEKCIIRTICFEVYKLDLSNSSWIELKDIREEVLFLGYNSSILMSSRDFPGFKGNRIYFTDSPFSFGGKEYNQDDFDIGVFNLVDGSFEPFSVFKCYPIFLWPPPIWVALPDPY